jgi:S1-C subfamily serine protease
MRPLRRAVWLGLLALVAVPGAAPAAPSASDAPRGLGNVSPLPSYVQRVEPAVLGLSVRAPEDAPSSQRLGSRRFGSGVVFDERGYAVTVSYLLLDALSIEARLRDGRRVPARAVAIDFDSGLGVVKLDGSGPWATAELTASSAASPGTVTGTVGVDEDNDLVHVTGSVHAIRPFAAYWEYMLDRALFVSPASPAWGGSAVVDDHGRVIGIASLRLGQATAMNLAIPAEKFMAVREELIAAGRVTSRPPRPWLGLYTVAVEGAVVVEGTHEVGPARSAGFRRGDRIVSVDGVSVASQEQFYERLWQRRAGDVIEVAVRRGQALEVLTVRSVDRHGVFRPRQ